MALASSNSNHPLKIMELCRVAPSPDSDTELSLPLTFFDTYWFKFPPVERLFFYPLTESSSSPSFFNSVILPKVKHSLSLTLRHFFPIAGRLTWPTDSPKPFIHYAPKDAISLTVAESYADFTRLSGDAPREAVESHPYLPQLEISEREASMLALQISLFPNQGFSIGISTHHGILDGKSATMFVKAWAHICKHCHTDQSLPPELTPVFDRTGIKDPQGFDMVCLNAWTDFFAGLFPDSNPQSLKVVPSIGAPSNIIRATFELSRENIDKLRAKVLSQLDKLPKGEQISRQTKPTYLSTFVLTFAYTLVCINKARGVESNTEVLAGFSADYRTRLDPPVPVNYFGNCVGATILEVDATVLTAENAIGLVAKRIDDAIRGFDMRTLEEQLSKLGKFLAMTPGKQLTGVAGSTRFEVYKADFGWGRPEKVEVTSIDKTGAISMAESRDGRGAAEIGVVLKKHEMEVFRSLFVGGLRGL